MKREILFRGKRVDNGEWVYGYFVKDPKGQCRIYLQPFDEATSNTYYFVQPETVGQYTGLVDKKYMRIFEGDITEHDDLIEWCAKSSGWAFKIFDAPTKQVIACHCLHCEGNFDIAHIAIDSNCLDTIAIVNNIHDNPKLLKGDQ